MSLSQIKQQTMSQTNLILTLFQNDSSFYKSMTFNVILIFVAVSSIFTTLYPSSNGYIGNIGIIGLVALLAVGYFLANTFVLYKMSSLNDTNKQLMVKLSELDRAMKDYVDSAALSAESRTRLNKRYKLTSLYIDANMITFLHSILPLYNYNPEQFFKVLRATDNILHIRNEIEKTDNTLINLPEMLEIAIEMRGQGISALHDFIYTVPKTNKMYTYLHDVVDRYNVLISRNIDIIHHYYKSDLKNRGISSSTKFVSWNTTKAFDPLQNQSITPHTQSPSTLNFYI